MIQKQNHIRCLGITSKDFTIDNTKKTGLIGYITAFYVNYIIIDTNDILDIHKYLTKIT